MEGRREMEREGQNKSLLHKIQSIYLFFLSGAIFLVYKFFLVIFANFL